ncbi:MAG: MFS transporter, partial [bacterium]
IADEKYQGTIQGIASSCGSLASIFGLISGGLLYEKAGIVAFIISAIIVFIVFLLAIRLFLIQRNSAKKA